jgi:hypothetical protein
VIPRRPIHLTATALQENLNVNQTKSLDSRLEPRTSKVAQVKDAGRTATGAHMFVHDLAARLRTPRCVVLGAALLMLLFAALPNVSSAQAAGPEWKLTVTPNADYFLSGAAEYPGLYRVEAENIGSQATSSEVTLEDFLPSGLSATGVHFYDSEVVEGFGAVTDLHEAHCSSFVVCTFPGGLPALKPHQKLVMVVLATVPSGVEGPIQDRAKVSGGGAPTVEAGVANAASANPPFGLLHFDSAITDPSANSYTQAGGRPYQFSAEFNFATYSRPANREGTGEPDVDSATASVRDPKEIITELPAGLLANPQGVPHCSLADWFSEECARKKVDVGVACISDENQTSSPCSTISPVFNLQPQGSYPGLLGIPVGRTPFVVVTAGLRSGSDYGVTATNRAPQVNISRVRVTLWGVPAAHEHDAMRGKECPASRGDVYASIEEVELRCEHENIGGEGGAAEVPATPFLIMPTECSGRPLAIGGRYDSWQVPGEYAQASAESPAVDGCNALSFEPKIEARPTTNLADSPSGLAFDLHVPQNEEPEGVATPELREAVVKLPAGIALNPSAGEGLEGCSEAQVGLHTEEPAQCPDASKLGTVEVLTPLLAEPLDGSLYLATPHQNPSGNLLAGYIVVEGQGVKVKLAGQFHTDPTTGQITASFLQNPQLPFEDFKINAFGGARGALRTPAVCGTYETTSTLTPYSAPESGPPAEPTSEFETIAGPGGEGSACPTSAAAEPHAPAFHAGTESTQAGAYSPFSLKLVRQDGEQEISKIETTLPEGLVGRLAGTTYCPDAALASAAGKSGVAEQQSPSCPSSSQVGTVDVASGAGPTPLDVPGKAYLAGPYKGAPLSLAIITPAVAGPFDLGTVVVRTALQVDPLTTQITAKSDPIPTILEGIPLDVRSVTLQMDKPNFTLNPTSCEAKAITGTALTSLGASASLNQRFQVGNCPALGFKPGLKISLKGSTKHAGHPALKAVVTYPSKGSYANIASAQVNLPHSEFIDQANLNKTCTKPVLLEGACPATSIYGKVKAWTPLLEKPLEGPVYLVGGFGYKLPALVAELDGQIKVLLVGKVDSGPNKGIRNTFEAVPDAPVEKFVLEMKGGKKYSLLENSENLCAKAQKAIASFTAQSGKTLELHPTVANSCGKKGKKHKGHHKTHKTHKDHGGAGGHGTPRDRALTALLARGW